ncbi:hypothetical protein [Streptomyces sp. NPDC008137]|uniref:hypothetical protein n=1 Tax=Streptomyces sp. NPDC008137 TaxID=3364813 RepID=UPI0036EC3D1F
MGTQTTDSMTKGMQALVAMETNAARLSEVAVQLLTAHAAGLPELLAVRAEATQDRPHLALQPKTPDDARLWARALGMDVKVTVEDGGEDQLLERAAVEFTVDGVLVRLAACRWYSADQWAERIAEAVAA